MYGREEHDAFHYATDQDWDNAEASQLGADNPDQAWVLTDRDVWHANPYYVGPPVPHPEDDYAREELANEDDYTSYCRMMQEEELYGR